MGRTIEAVLGLRARLGSREALLRAAFDLADTMPGLHVRRRSLVWNTPEPEDALCAAIGLTADFSQGVLEAAARALEQRIGRGAVGPQAPLLVELLWAYDPLGTPGPTTPIPEPDPLAGKRPPLPPGRSFLHPEVPTRASACGPLSEVETNARDPANGRFVSEFLYTVPEPYLERPRPFTPSFEIVGRGIDGGVAYEVVTFEDDDLLAAAAEAYGRAPPSGEPRGPGDPIPDATIEVSAPMPRDATPEQRLSRWLHAVHEAIVRERLWLRRAVVLRDVPDAVDGVLFGVVGHAPPDLGALQDVRASFDASTNRYRAELEVRVR